MTEVAAIRRRLYARRYALGLGQREVAKRMGTTQSALSDLETGNTKSPRLETIIRWAEALGLRVDISIDDPQRSR
jgi:transcriptional regulator with XRE-family HTH domain